METMIEQNKINVRGSINSLELGSEPLILSRRLYKPSMVRTTAGGITEDTGKRFSVTSRGDEIIVTRKH
jgi:hypothetical protein